MLIVGFILFGVAYAFAWKYWLKKDLLQDIKLHWGWCVAFGVLTLFGLFWMFMNIAFAPMAVTNSFIVLEGRTDVIFFVQLFFVIAYPVAEYFITKKKQETEPRAQMVTLSWVYVAVVFPLLLIAAAVEAFVTPHIMALFI